MSRDGVSPTGRSGESPCCERTRRLLGPRPRLRSGRQESRPLGGGGEVFPALVRRGRFGFPSRRHRLGHLLYSTAATRPSVAMPARGARLCLLLGVDWAASRPPRQTGRPSTGHAQCHRPILGRGMALTGRRGRCVSGAAMPTDIRSAIPTRVLLVDDHPTVLMGLRAVLSADDDIDVVAAVTSGEECLRSLDHETPDVVLLDLSMPGRGGLETLQLILQRVPDTAVLVLTVSADERDVTEAIRLGASGYLLKDIEAEQLVRSVRAASRGDLPMDPRVTRCRLRLRRPLQDRPLAARLRGPEPLAGGTEQQVDRRTTERPREDREGTPDQHLRPHRSTGTHRRRCLGPATPRRRCHSLISCRHPSPTPASELSFAYWGVSRLSYSVWVGVRLFSAGLSAVSGTVRGRSLGREAPVDMPTSGGRSTAGSCPSYLDGAARDASQQRPPAQRLTETQPIPTC